MKAERIVNGALTVLLAACTIFALTVVGEAADAGRAGGVVAGALFALLGIAATAFFGRDLFRSFERQEDHARDEAQAQAALYPLDRERVGL